MKHICLNEYYDFQEWEPTAFMMEPINHWAVLHTDLGMFYY